MDTTMPYLAVILTVMTSLLCVSSNTTSVKLLGGDGTYGAVQLTHAGRTGMLCDDVFENNWHGAAVVCRMLGLTGAARYVMGMEYNYVRVTFLLNDVDCVGNETSIDDCNHSDWGSTSAKECYFPEQAGVICEPTLNNVSVKLLGGDGTYGAVEVTYQGRTGMICDDQFRGTINGANVVCRMLGFPGAYNYTNGQAYNSNTNVSFILDDVNCVGDETSIEYCSHRSWETHDCSDSEQAGVVCLPVVPHVSVRLIGGDGTFGAVEVTYNGSTGMVCDDLFSGNIYGPNVVCRMLGFPRAKRYTNGTAYSSNPHVSFLLDDVKCSGSEESIEDCQHTDWGHADCADSEQAGVVCDSNPNILVNVKAKLIGGDGSYGAVQVTYNRTSQHSITGMLCADVFENNLNGPNVVCRMLGFPGAHNYTNGFTYTRDTNAPFLLDDLTCSGRETSIAECYHRTVGGHNCRPSEQAGVVCLPRGLPVVG